MEPLVSVIIPVYNVFPYLREALDSVINQTYRNLEIIIVDDGSMDGSQSICDEYTTDPRVKVIHQENRGLSGARNTGLDQMTGSFVTFLDPDDAYHLDMIRALMGLMDYYKADISACSIGIYKTEGFLGEAKQKERVQFKEQRTYTSREAIIGQIEGTFGETVWNKLYKQSLWKQLRFPDGYVYEDTRIMPLLYERCKRIIVTPQVLVYHRIRENSITNTFSVQNMQDLFETYRVLREYTDQANPPFPKKSIQHMHGTMLRTLVFHWAEMRKQGIPSDDVNETKKVITKFAETQLDFRQIRTRITWGMFQNCPQLLLPTRKCYQLAKKILRRQ